VVPAPAELHVAINTGRPQSMREMTPCSLNALGSMRGWGLTRVSIDWATPGVREALDLIDRIGWDVNLYGVPDLEAFLEAALLLPTSVTADLNFPEWNYHGRGPLRGVAVAASSC
jgi:hypothetical protein